GGRAGEWRGPAGPGQGRDTLHLGLAAPVSLQEGPAELATLDGTALLWSADGAGAAGCELDAALAAELLELLGPESAAGTEPVAPPPGSASSGSSPRREREQANEQRVLELTAHNERLREEIQRLSAEVERTRAALIDRIVNLRRT
uniref:DNA damage-inducible transcript 3 protein n=1 Tax=Apteryx owenii TaxID=8824 RepID=A0A8B9PSE6_APTOW